MCSSSHIRIDGKNLKICFGPAKFPQFPFPLPFWNLLRIQQWVSPPILHQPLLLVIACDLLSIKISQWREFQRVEGWAVGF